MLWRTFRESVQQSEGWFHCRREVFRAVSVGQTFLAQPEARRHNGHSAGSRGLDVLCEREYDKLQTPFLGRVVQPGTVLIGHDWLPGEPVGWVLNTSRWCVQVLLEHVKKSDGKRGTLEISKGQWHVHDLDKSQTMPTEYPFKRVHGAGGLIPRRFEIEVGHHCRHESAQACCLFRLPTSRQE